MPLPAYVILKPEKEASIERRHPWVFSGAIQSRHGRPRTGDRVAVRTAAGRWMGWGHFTKDQSIAVRLLEFDTPEPPADFWHVRMNQALALRKRLGLLDGEATNSCRLIHGEGDGLPGLIVDWYAGVAVLQLHTLGMLAERAAIVEALVAVSGDQLQAIYDKSASVLARHHQVTHTDGTLHGTLPAQVLAREHGCTFEVDVVRGQKTGFFLDQRDNRAWVGSFARGKRVLNVFSYTGGFSISALAGGAEVVHSLDSSARALEVGDRNVALNFEGANHRSIEADALEYLKDHSTDYDVVVLDPPAFAKGAHSRDAAVHAYRRLNAMTLKGMPADSLLFTFSCSQAVDESLFQRTVLSAAVQAGRTVQVLKRLQQPADHPVAGGHPEGSYLKGLLLRVL